MKRNFKIIFSILFLLTFFSCNPDATAKEENEYNASATKNGITLKVQSKKDGLHISKKNPTKLFRVTVHVIGSDGQNFSIESADYSDSFFYPFVKEDEEYTVFLSMMDASWQNYTESARVKVKAKGGLGNLKVSFSSSEYDQDNCQILLKDFHFEYPQNLALGPGTFSGNLYYDITNGINWSACFWASYQTKENGNDKIVVLKNNLNNFAGKDFLMQLNMSLTYDGTTFVFPILTEANRFKDNHSKVRITSDKGILQPIFNPAVKNYTLAGTEENATLSFYKNADSESPDQTKVLEATEGQSVDFSDENGFKYTITFSKSEKVTFNNSDYLLTFYDDFSESELDLTKWKRCNQEERQASQANHGWWSDECSYIENGSLIIEGKEKNGMLLSGGIESDGLFEQTYGLYEIKFKVEKTTGLWYAFWLMGDNDEAHVGNGAVDAAEIDIFEIVANEPYGNGPNLLKTSVHWDAYSSNQKSAGSPNYNFEDSFYDEWHIAKFIWGKENYELYIDDAQIFKLNGEDFGGICQAKNYIIISSEFGAWGGPKDTSVLPSKMYVDYVKVYALKE